MTALAPITLARAVEDASRRLEANFAARDVEALVADYYVAEPMLIGEGQGVFAGREGAARYFGGAIAAFRACRLETRSLTLAGETAFETGEVMLSPIDANAEAVVLSYFVVWRWQAEHGWRVRLDYFVPGRLG
jgi:ketosteroid isomerase-like protein